MNKTFNLLFFIKKNKIRTNGTAPHPQGHRSLNTH